MSRSSHLCAFFSDLVASHIKRIARGVPEDKVFCALFFKFLCPVSDGSLLMQWDPLLEVSTFWVLDHIWPYLAFVGNHSGNETWRSFRGEKHMHKVDDVE